MSRARRDWRRTIDERCALVAELVNDHDQPAVAWCNLNDESAHLARSIRGAVEVSGSDREEEKEERLTAFLRGEARVLVTKPSIAGLGLNLQHCAHETFFPSHSYEQYYQAVRRCWRFGQQSPVTVDVVTTEGQADVLANLQRKEQQAGRMFDQLVALMWQEMSVRRQNDYTVREEMPAWL